LTPNASGELLFFACYVSLTARALRRSTAAFLNGAAREMNMMYRLLTASSAICALTLLGFSAPASAVTSPILKASPSLTILAGAGENPEVQNLLDPEATNGVPGGPTAATLGDQPNAGGEMKAMPEGGGGDSGVGENKAIDQEEGK